MPAGVKALAALGVADAGTLDAVPGDPLRLRRCRRRGRFSRRRGRRRPRHPSHRAPRRAGRARRRGGRRARRGASASRRCGLGEVRTAGTSWPCRFVVGADGLHSRVRRAAGLEAWRGRARAGAKGWNARARFGVSRHLRLAPLVGARRGDLRRRRRGLRHTARRRRDRCGDPVERRQGRLRRASGNAFPCRSSSSGSRAGRFSVATTAPVRCGQPTRGAVDRSGRIALVGDAAGYVDALTGEGLSLGFESALALADALAAGDLARLRAQARPPLGAAAGADPAPPRRGAPPRAAPPPGRRARRRPGAVRELSRPPGRPAPAARAPDRAVRCASAGVSPGRSRAFSTAAGRHRFDRLRRRRSRPPPRGAGALRPARRRHAAGAGAARDRQLGGGLLSRRLDASSRATTPSSTASVPTPALRIVLSGERLFSAEGLAFLARLEEASAGIDGVRERQRSGRPPPRSPGAVSTRRPGRVQDPAARQPARPRRRFHHRQRQRGLDPARAGGG